MTDAVMAEFPPSTIDLQYDGRTFGFTKIVGLNLLLQILTLGIFRFWARTRERRYIWSHVRVGDDRLEYTGTGMELFVGFLIAMFILVPVGGIYQVLLTLFADSPVGLGISVGLYMTVLMFLIFIAIYRARRYRLTRTLWRGIRGTLTGSPTRYALAGMGYYLLVIATFGLASPLMRIGLFRREIENTHIGNRPFAFDGRARDLLKMWMIPWAVLLILGGGVFWMQSTTGMFDTNSYEAEIMNEGGAENPDSEFADSTMNPAGPGTTMPDSEIAIDDGEIPPSIDSSQQMAVALVSLGYIALILTFAWYNVWEFRYLAGRTTFEGMRFSSTLHFGRVLWIYVSFFLTVTLLVFGVATAIAIIVLLADGRPLDPETAQYTLFEHASWLPFVAFLAVFLIMPVLSRVMIFHRMARTVVTTLAITGTENFGRITQALDQTPSMGEGLADAFDLGNF